MSTEIIEELAKFTNDPLGFVRFAFPWGEPGELENDDGPEVWQRELLQLVGSGVFSVAKAVELAAGREIDTTPILLARTSGHGIGKSAMVSWLILWAISTFEDTKGIITANTETQLRTKTWSELGKWHRLFIGKEFFKFTATSIYSADPAYEKTWRIDMVPWSEHNTEAFAGLHNKGKRLLVLFDEGSGIDDLIYEVTEGTLTDRNTQIIWAVFGNPTQNSGRFRDCFEGGKFAHRWNSAAIDSREVRFSNKQKIKEWIEDYGEDSDFVRVRVRGVFPRIDSQAFIPKDLVLEAVARNIEVQYEHPVVLGVDVARFGNDASVIYPRRGRDAFSLPVEVYFGMDTMEFASRVASAALLHNAQVVFVDGGGVGGGVVDRLRMLNVPVIDVQFGARSDLYANGVRYANKRAEIWGSLREWLKTGKIVERVKGIDNSLPDEFSSVGYGMNKNEQIQLESKIDLRNRGIKSANVADALACTFALPIHYNNSWREEKELEKVPDYNPYSRERMYNGVYDA